MTRGLRDSKPFPSVALSLGLPVTSSVLYVLAFPNFNQSWLAWIALVPLALHASRATPRMAFMGGWLSGTLSYAGILYWIVVTFAAAHLSLGLAYLCLMLLAGYLGLYWGAWSWILARADRHSSLQICLYGGAAWVALEYLRTYLFSGFPWALLADSQVRMLPLIQIASISGVYGVSFFIVFVNITIAEWRLKPAILSVGMLALVCLYGGYRLKTHVKPQGRKIKIALLQGSIDQYKKWNKAYVEDIEKTYETLAEEAAKSKPDIMIWPETSVPGYLTQDPPLHDWLKKVVQETHTDHIVGAPVMRNEMAYNSAFSLNSKGILEGEYAKRHLVPFGEIVPWSNVLGRFITVLNDLGGFTAGNQSPVLNVAGTSWGVNICYEAIFPNLVRQSVKQGAGAIVNLTNDGWYMKTAEPYQHWAPNVFRAVENARWVLRADNTGISGILDPNGRVQAASRIFEPVVIQGSITTRSVLTFYSRFGDFFAWLCVFFCGMIFLRDILHP